MKTSLPYLEEQVIRREDRVWVYLRVRIGGKRIRLKCGPSSPKFLAEYNAAVAALKPASGPAKAKEGTMGELASMWFASASFRRAEPSTKDRQRVVIEECLREPIRPGDMSRVLRDCPVSAFSGSHVRALRDRRADMPASANERVKFLSGLFRWACEAEKAPLNPCRDVQRVKYASEGFYTWTRSDVAQFIARHPIGTKAYLALAVLLMTGVRRSDAILIGRQHMRDGSIVFVPRKTAKKKPAPLVIPILPALQEAMEQTPHTAECLTILESELGRPYASPSRFGARFKKWVREAGLEECSAHGLRKLAAVSMAEAGATTKQLMASFGWSSPAQAERYIARASQERMAADAMPLIGKIG